MSLKTYVTTSGFFEVAVAAPSMKAALKIWGAGPDLFRRGYAKETHDAAVVKATMARPGTVLKRAVGSQGAFKENADLPDVSTWEDRPKNPAPSKLRAAPRPSPSPKPAKAKAPYPAAERKAKRLFEAAQKQREREAARAEAAARKELDRRERAISTAQAAIQKARAEHDERVAAIEKERDILSRRAHEEDERWEREKSVLEAALHRVQA